MMILLLLRKAAQFDNGRRGYNNNITQQKDDINVTVLRKAAQFDNGRFGYKNNVTLQSDDIVVTKEGSSV
jgi:hypothetical protein